MSLEQHGRAICGIATLLLVAGLLIAYRSFYKLAPSRAKEHALHRASGE